MIRTIKVALAAVSVLLCATGCDGYSGLGFANETAKNTYHNDLYRLTVVAPDGWYVMNAAETRAMQDVGAKTAAGKDQELKAALAAKNAGADGAIFSFFRSQPGTVSAFNPSVAAAAESLALAPGVKTGRDYFDQMKELMMQSAVVFDIQDGYGTRTIGGQSFDRMDLKITVNGITARQSYYAALYRNSAITIIQSYDTDKDKAETDKVIDSVKLDW